MRSFSCLHALVICCTTLLFVMTLQGCFTDENVLRRMRNSGYGQPRQIPQQQNQRAVGRPCPICGVNIQLRKECTKCNGTGTVYN